MKKVTLDWLFSSSPIDLVVTNGTRLSSQYSSLYPNSVHVIAADGGSNLIREYMEQTGENLPPHKIIGDLDSITPETKAYFRNVPVFLNDDQNLSDLEKAMSLAVSDTVIVLGEFGGRVDHFFKLISVLDEYLSKGKTVFSLGSDTLIFVVGGGHTEVNLCDYQQWKYYGLVPMKGPTQVSTTGFKWDLAGETMQLGGLISTSNEVICNVVSVQSTKELIFTCSRPS